MKKDIDIPASTDVHLAIIHEYNELFKTHDWTAYLINQKEAAIDMVLIVSHGYHDSEKTSVMRHKLNSLPAKSAAKVELMQEEVLKLNNEFKLTYFYENRLFEKTYLLKKNSAKEKALRPIKFLNKRGLLLK